MRKKNKQNISRNCPKPKINKKGGMLAFNTFTNIQLCDFISFKLSAAFSRPWASWSHTVRWYKNECQTRFGGTLASKCRAVMHDDDVPAIVSASWLRTLGHWKLNIRLYCTVWWHKISCKTILEKLKRKTTVQSKKKPTVLIMTNPTEKKFSKRIDDKHLDITTEWCTVNGIVLLMAAKQRNKPTKIRAAMDYGEPNKGMKITMVLNQTRVTRN